MSRKCVICGKEIPEQRKGHDACSVECAVKKVVAWATYIRKHRDEILEAALNEFKSGKEI